MSTQDRDNSGKPQATPPGHSASAADQRDTPADKDSFPELELVLEDTASLRQRGVAVPVSTTNGYNPYNTGPGSGKRLAKEAPPAPAKRTDLRQLSEWIKAQRRAEDAQKDDGEEPK